MADAPRHQKAILREYRAGTKRSRRLYGRASLVIPSGTNRGVIFYPPYPVYSERAEGSRLWDVDGTERIDYCYNYSSLILGHRNPKVMEALEAEAAKGLGRGQPTGPEVELAELVVESVPAAEMVKFTVTGSEAVMNALRAARAHTGREKIISFAGSYHGSSDSVTASGLAFSSQGVLAGVLRNTVVIPFDDQAALERAMKENRGEVAAVIMEPFLAAGGTIAPNPGFARFVRELTEKEDVLFIMDEIVTGFRTSAGGWSGKYGLRPDLITLGKNLTGGMPGGAVSGRKEVMEDVFAYKGEPSNPERMKARAPLSGTFNAFPLSMAAGIATLKQLGPLMYEAIDSRAKMLCEGFERAAESLGMQVSAPRVGSVFQFYLGKTHVTSLESAKKADAKMRWLLDIAMLNEGVFLAPSHFCCTSAATSEADVKETLRAAERSLEKLGS